MDSITETMRNCERLLQKYDPVVIGDNTKGLSSARVRELLIDHNIQNAPGLSIRKQPVNNVVPFTCASKSKAKPEYRKSRPYKRTKKVGVIRKSKNRRHPPLGDFTTKAIRKSRVVKKFISEMKIDSKTLILRSEYNIVSREEITSGKSFKIDELTSMMDHYLITRIK